ncbi:hypothetical protein [Aureispira anguillae]|uniref:Long-chain fatty acid transport protein n=1 Tax=Aureispira anguillae TaxID=2864201 RepID=A0A915YK73_9BACT|nr:hypothetical protein [Aureispira anguillae]BDS14603.1 hypothetical protein AsAng_0053840 [Aureispira anguillae]
MQQLFKQLFTPFVVLFLMVAVVTVSEGQYSRGNSPYSRYGLGDLKGSLFTPNASMSGGLSATYRSYWDVNLTNPASLGKLRYTSFQLGLDYQHSELSEKNTGLTAQADNGNLTYISLAFPITKSWEIMRDTLRRGVPIQWGMGFSLMPYSQVNYDVAVTRSVGSVPNVLFNYTGEGNKYRVNWSNGFTYKGFSAGANLGLLFGKISNNTYIDFQDSAYAVAYDERLIVEENGVGFIWDLGVQYEYVFKSTNGKTSPDPNFSIKNKLTIGAYAGGVSDIITTSSKQYTRQSSYHPVDSIQNISGVKGTLNMPIKIGGGVSFGKELGLIVGASYETEMWSMFRRDGVADANLENSHRIAVGMQIVPDFSDYTSYFNRIRYRVGAHYGLDARAFTAKNGTRYQLMDYGLSVGAGFPMRPPKAKSILGFVNLGLDIGYLGHPELIGDVYFRVNLGFALNASGWFNRSKFR